MNAPHLVVERGFEGKWPEFQDAVSVTVLSSFLLIEKPNLINMVEENAPDASMLRTLRKCHSATTTLTTQCSVHTSGRLSPSCW
jgi:hypothetical protein